jgi:hypothetical protein
MVGKYKIGEVIAVGDKEWVVSSADDGTTILLPKEDAPKPASFITTTGTTTLTTTGTTFTIRLLPDPPLAQAAPDRLPPHIDLVYGVFSRKQAEENGSAIWSWDGKVQQPITDILYLSDKKVKLYPDMMIVGIIHDITTIKYIEEHQNADWWKRW